MEIDLTVNGRQVTVETNATTPLLDVLRNNLDLKEFRYGPGLEQCGACMVLIDGEAEYACAREIGAVSARSITTIEGLGTPEHPHPLQRTFLRERAGQGGYCLSGIIIQREGIAGSAVPKPSSAYTVVKQPVPRRDLIAKVTGAALQRPGTCIAMIASSAPLWP